MYYIMMVMKDGDDYPVDSFGQLDNLKVRVTDYTEDAVYILDDEGKRVWHNEFYNPVTVTEVQISTFEWVCPTCSNWNDLSLEDFDNIHDKELSLTTEFVCKRCNIPTDLYYPKIKNYTKIKPKHKFNFLKFLDSQVG